jgi:enoyl-CoA hydratase
VNVTDAPFVKARVTDNTLRVVIDRPEKRNALSRAILAALQQVFDAHAGLDSLRLAVLTSTGDKSFAAGGDLKELSAIRTVEDAARFSDESHQALDRIRRFPVPVVAALNGDALGGGAELAMACDLRVMAAHAGIGFIQGRLNITTGWGAGPDLMRLVGSSRALLLLCRSDRIAATDAERIGLVDSVCPAGEAFEPFVERFVVPIRGQSPMVTRAFKAQAIAERFGDAYETRRRLECADFSRSWAHADHWAAADELLPQKR